MGYKLQITESAEKDLDDILTYIMGELDNMEAALHLADEIDQRYIKLEENPYLYEECRDPRLKLLGYRKVVLGGYLMIYRVDQAQETVYIERYFGHLQDYAKKL